jgi:hypothetical protein
MQNLVHVGKHAASALGMCHPIQLPSLVLVVQLPVPRTLATEERCISNLGMSNWTSTVLLITVL